MTTTTELTTIDGAALTTAQTAILSQQTPASAILTRPGPGGKQLSYVTHSWVTATLNQAFGWAWSWEIQEWRLTPEAKPTEVFVLGKLTIHGQNGRDLVKTQFGSHSLKQAPSVGDALKAASSDALKKAASLFGLALDLYSSDAPKQRPPARKANGANGTAKRNGNGAFASKGEAIAWAMSQDVFKAGPHAAKAYEKLRGQQAPTSAAEMARLWREDVARRKAEKERDEALPAEPTGRGRNKLFK